MQGMLLRTFYTYVMFHTTSFYTGFEATAKPESLKVDLAVTGLKSVGIASSIWQLYCVSTIRKILPRLVAFHVHGQGGCLVDLVSILQHTSYRV